MKARIVGVSLLVFFCLAAGYAQEGSVPTVLVANPIIGFSVRVPEDWTMGTGLLGDTTLGLNNPSHPSFAAPLVSFLYLPAPPAQAAQFLQRVFAPLATQPPAARATGRGDEWEITAIIQAGMLGLAQGCWRVRGAGKHSYYIGAIVPANHAAEWAAEISMALESARPMPLAVPITYFREPGLDAFRLILPRGWKYDGQVVSGPNVPAAYVYKIQSPDGTAGCFSAYPVQGQAAGLSFESLCSELLLPELRQELPDVRLEAIHLLPRASLHYTLSFRALGPDLNIQGGRAWADFVGTRRGVPIRVRVEIYAHFVQGLLPGVPGWAHVQLQGAWAPVAEFEALYPLARSVQASLRETPMWRRRLLQTTREVLDYRQQVFEEAAADWDAYIRERDRIQDPDTGEFQEIPYGDGDVVKDLDGHMYRVPKGASVPAGAKLVPQNR